MGRRALPCRGFGIPLRRLREGAGLTLAELSARTGISDRHLSAVERGKRRLHDGLMALAVEAVRALDSASHAD